MKIIDQNFKLPGNPVILELQIYCKKLILNPSCMEISNLFDLKKRVQQHTSLIGLNYADTHFEYIYYEVSSNLTHDVFKVTYNEEAYITITARKKEFEFAFKDFDAGRFN
jgi:hypothetical protein